MNTEEIFQIKISELRRYPGFKSRRTWERAGGVIGQETKPAAIVLGLKGEELYPLYTADDLEEKLATDLEKFESEDKWRARVRGSVEKCRDILAHPHDYLLLDIEATDNKVLELVLVDLQGEVVYESLFKPTGRISSDTIRIHGIRKEDVKDAPRFISEWPKIQQLIAGKTLLIFSATNDINFIRRTIEDMEWETPNLCVQELYYQYRDFREQQSLVNACMQCDIKVQESHRAKVDCLMTRELILAMANEVPLNTDYEAVVRKRKRYSKPKPKRAFSMDEVVDSEMLEALKAKLST